MPELTLKSLHLVKLLRVTLLVLNSHKAASTSPTALTLWTCEPSKLKGYPIISPSAYTLNTKTFRQFSASRLTEWRHSQTRRLQSHSPTPSSAPPRSQSRPPFRTPHSRHCRTIHLEHSPLLLITPSRKSTTRKTIQHHVCPLASDINTNHTSSICKRRF